MRVRELVIRGFTSHAGESRIKLPSAGVVVVRGPNGAGKSSILEAVSTVGWGESLRGTDPWREKQVGSVSGLISTPLGDVEITRSRSASGKKSLSWKRAAWPDPVAYETTTKAQEALTSAIGEWDLWRRAFVFSSADAAQFSGATDAERKRILERLLGLAQYEAAAAIAASELSALNRATSEAQQKATVLKERLTAAQEAHRLAKEQAAKERPTGKPSEELHAEAERLRAAMQSAVDSAAKHRRVEQNARKQAITLSGVLDAESNRLARLSAAGGACPTCAQPLADAIHLLGEHLAKLRADTGPQIALAKADMATATRAAELQEAEARTHQGAINELQAQARVFDSQQRAFERASAAIENARDRQDEADIAYENAEDAYQTALQKLLTAEQVSKVFGTKGVRAHILGRAMDGLSRASSRWLSKLSGGDITLDVKPYSEKKSGGLSDAIAISVSIAGASPRGYTSLSGGERRRVDVALLLGLSELAQASSGFPEGSTFWIDEAGDALDADGIVAFADVLAELAKDRCIVIITHSDSMIQAFKSAHHRVLQIIVEDGILRVL